MNHHSPICAQLTSQTSHNCWVLWIPMHVRLEIWHCWFWAVFPSRKCFSSQLWKDHPDCGCASEEIRAWIWVVVPRLHCVLHLWLGGLLFPIGLNEQAPFGCCLKVFIEFLSEVWGLGVLDLAPRIVRWWEGKKVGRKADFNAVTVIASRLHYTSLWFWGPLVRSPLQTLSGPLLIPKWI